MEAALWAFYTTSSFKEGALAAVNLGDDADTVGAIYGQLAGAFYGVNVDVLSFSMIIVCRQYQRNGESSALFLV